VKELETTMTQKGQVTIPAAIRARLGLRAKDRVRFEVDGDEVKLRPASSKLLAGFGAVVPHRRPEDWQEVEDAVEQLMAAEVAAED
jgi:AbrB family looped-hinge helix DNA binding protein